jgi:hypothetical protein
VLPQSVVTSGRGVAMTLSIKPRLIGTALILGAAALAPLSASTPDRGVPLNSKRILKARQILAEDPLLSPYNLAVTMRGDTAVVGGTVPSAELARRAVERLRDHSIFAEVRSELMIDARCVETASLPLTPSGVPEPGPPLPLADPKAHLSGALTGRDPVKPPATRPLDEAVWLLPPKPLASDKSEPPAAVFPARGAETLKDPSDAVEQLRRSDARYRQLQVSVREGVVTVRGDPAREDMMAFYQAVRGLDGVKRVVLEPMERTSPPPR